MSFSDAKGRIEAFIRIAGDVGEGAKNTICPTENVEALSAKRLSVCKDCHNFKYTKLIDRKEGKTHPVFPETIVDNLVIDMNSAVCNRVIGVDGKPEKDTGCGCNLMMKTRTVNGRCELGKW